ncbi:MAG: hypothetical protein EXS16_20705 [Gemmataceae bacterium]|nr:hypothetical protein [Gemmataceae bacterium]
MSLMSSFWEKISSTAESAVESVKETASDVADAVEDAAESASEAVEDAVEAVSDGAEAVYDVASDAAETVEEKVTGAYENSYFGRDDAARPEVENLTPDEIQHMPTADRNRLMKELQEGWFSDEDKEATKKLFSVKYLDPEFEKIDDDNRKKMIDKFKADPAFKEARDNWETLTEAKRVEIMQKAVDYQAEAYDIPKTTIATYSNDDPTDLGYYRHSDGKLYINGHDAALKNGGFDEAIDTAVHENGHRYQATLIDQLEAGKIKEGDPLYNQAMTFKLNDTQRGFYVQPPGDTPSVDTGDEYFTQPQENHSRITGTAVQQAGIGK